MDIERLGKGLAFLKEAEPVLTMLCTLVDGETRRRIDGGQ